MIIASLSLLLLAQSPDASFPARAIARIERTTCFGWCPGYALTVFDDGHLEWEGRSFVKVKGKATGKLSAAELQSVKEAFDGFGFLDLPGGYDCYEWTDNPTVFLSYRSGDRARTLKHYQGCKSPRGTKELTAFEDRLDVLLKSVRWMGTDGERRRMKK